MTRADMAGRIDHTNLRTDADRRAIEHLCAEAATWRFAGVVVFPHHVPLAATALRGAGVAVGTVVGFPHGASRIEAKRFEARDAVRVGASELDMVLNIGALLSDELDVVARDIRSVVEEGHAGGALVKVILETCYLSDGQKRIAARLAADVGADYVKTSTGLGPGGATVYDVRLLCDAVSGRCRVKAAGGVRTAEDARAMIDAGADRIGTSAGVQIVGSLG
ncbi:MAG TPA: deoxyribose-phosphate aldolase [Chthonomonadales bacterium]|nr:deoxyribose-phosphate aldolase [Chthonomonadales bacterium]